LPRPSLVVTAHEEQLEFVTLRWAVEQAAESVEGVPSFNFVDTGFVRIKGAIAIDHINTQQGADGAGDRARAIQGQPVLLGVVVVVHYPRTGLDPPSPGIRGWTQNGIDHAAQCIRAVE